MRNQFKILFAMLILLGLLPGNAFAASQETLIGRSVICGYYAIWNYPDQPDRYQAMPTSSTIIGNLSLGQSVPSYYADYGCPFNVNDYQNVRVVVKNPDGIDQQTYNSSTKWNSGISYDDFYKRYIDHMPAGFSVSRTSSESQYNSVRVKWGLNLNNIPPAPGKVAVNIKDPSILDYYVPTWGSSPPSGFAQSTKAWLWSLPVMIEWYGTPKGSHDLQFTDYAPQIYSDIIAGKKVSGSINIKNLSEWPTLAAYTKLRIYTLEDGKSTPDLQGVYPVGLPGQATDAYAFDFDCPGKPFKLIATVDMDSAGSSWNCLPLNVLRSSGPYCAMEEEYERNKAEIFLIPRADGGSSEPKNLSVTGIKFLDQYNNPVGGSLQSGQSYKVQVNYLSTFSFSGLAKVGLYIKSSNGNVRQIGNTVWEPLGAFGTGEQTWNFNASDGTLIATIGLDWRGDTSFSNLQYEGQTEITYTDNKLELPTATTESTSGPPESISWETNVYYHPDIEDMIPIYKTVTEQKWVGTKRKIKYSKDEKQARVKTILVQ